MSAPKPTKWSPWVIAGYYHAALISNPDSVAALQGFYGEYESALRVTPFDIVAYSEGEARWRAEHPS
jgi:hypothetical protein